MKTKIFAMFAVMTMTFMAFGTICSAAEVEVAEMEETAVYIFGPYIATVTTDKEAYNEPEDVTITVDVNPLMPIRYPREIEQRLLEYRTIYPIYLLNIRYRVVSMSGSINDAEGNEVAPLGRGTTLWSVEDYNPYLGAGQNDFTAEYTVTGYWEIVREPYSGIMINPDGSYTVIIYPISPIYVRPWQNTGSAAFSITNTGQPVNPGPPADPGNGNGNPPENPGPP